MAEGCLFPILYKSDEIVQRARTENQTSGSTNRLNSSNRPDNQKSLQVENMVYHYMDLFELLYNKNALPIYMICRSSSTAGDIGLIIERCELLELYLGARIDFTTYLYRQEKQDTCVTR